MLILMFFFLLFLFIPLIIIIFNLILSKKISFNREKMSPFECGFDPFTKMRTPFSTHFFMISLIFLIFDIEISLIFPIISLFKNYNFFMIFSMKMFMIILIFGLYVEFIEQSLEWKK